MTLSAADRTRIVKGATLLREAERPVRVLRSVAWPLSVRERFLAGGATELPQVSYEPFDPDPTLRSLEQARAMIEADSPVDSWLARQADAIENGARMLAARGTPEFSDYGGAVYGTPTGAHADGSTTSLDLATQVDLVLEGFRGLDLGAPPDACHLASTVAEEMLAAARERFGDQAPEVVIVDDLSSNAIAGPHAIRIRRTACFSDRDIAQLIHHEAFIHVATSLNGRAQPDLPILGAGHPGTTATQEGLAIFAEFISGTMDVDRLGRLAGRVLAIQMALDGADFLEVHRFFRDRGLQPEQAFESTRRVFRGGVVTGGAPFLKDLVYLDGLLRVHNFLRAAVVAGRADCVRLLFCGKLDLEDLPALCVLSAEGLCRPPVFLPPWAGDLRFLLAYLSYSAFLNRVNLDPIREHFEHLLEEAPVVGVSPANLETAS